MSVPVEATTVVLLNSAIERQFAGGIDAFTPIVPNSTFCSDTHISRVCFMREVDADQFCKELEHYQLVPYQDFVILRVYMPLEEQTPNWLVAARYLKSLLVWKEGTDPSKVYAPESWDPEAEPLEHFSEEELHENYEFVECSDGVTTYAHKETGEKIYASETKPHAQRLFEEAVELAEPHLHLDGRRESDSEGKTALDRAIEILEQAVELEPDYWNAWWFLGKSWQAMGDREKALIHFKKSAEICGDENANTWREYMFECLNLGEGAAGVEAAEKAVSIEPDNDGLVSNQALAYLIAGRIKEAQITVKKARKLNRKDAVTKTLERVIKEVAKGKRPQPKNLRQLEG